MKSELSKQEQRSPTCNLVHHMRSYNYLEQSIVRLEFGTNNQHIPLGHEYSEERIFWVSVTQQYIVHPAVRPWPPLRRLEDVTACALPCWVAVVKEDGGPLRRPRV